MPNHVHGIVLIIESRDAQPDALHPGASTRPPLSPQSLGSIIRQFKSVSTKRIWKAGFRDFVWQPRFYDRIIRSEHSLDAIRRYIQENPTKWELDRDNLESLRM
ncbi:MAG TPA: transposase [Dehalococcoidia bacterium]|nr:transposase [Dehalococcoidia bacterium]